MKSSLILPTTIKSEDRENDIVKLSFVFNRWLRMVTDYSKLDETCVQEDFLLISRVIRNSGFSRRVRNEVLKCRDLALKPDLDPTKLQKQLRRTLSAIRLNEEDKAVRKIRRHHEDQGMTERYRPLAKQLEREKIHRLGTQLAFVDPNSGNSYESKLIRRIVEKRAAQTVHRLANKSGHHSNRFRQSVRRATSFSLYHSNFTDYDPSKRAPGTHWKVIYYKSKKQKVLKAKNSYNSFSAAAEAVERHRRNNPADTVPIEPYRCCYCNKWHIGHVRTFENCSHTSSDQLPAAG